MQTQAQAIAERMKSNEPLRWIFAGDSITHGALHTFGWRDYVELFAERLRFEVKRPRDFVITTAASGWTTQRILDDIEWNVLQFRPNVFSLMVGMNDACGGPDGVAGFRRNYDAILDRVNGCGCRHVILHTTNPIWPSCTSRASLPLYVEEIRRIARDRDAVLVDHDACWREAMKENPFRGTCWMNDEIHPGDFGHRAFVHLLLKELGLWDEKSYTCRLYVP